MLGRSGLRPVASGASGNPTTSPLPARARTKSCGCQLVLSKSCTLRSRRAQIHSATPDGGGIHLRCS
eukprot:1323070-Alexandrium_andersonii.AAC.1